MKVDTDHLMITIVHGGVQMFRRKNSAYTIEFKIAAVKLVKEEGYSLSEAARNRGVCKGTLSGHFFSPTSHFHPLAMAKRCGSNCFPRVSPCFHSVASKIRSSSLAIVALAMVERGAAYSLQWQRLADTFIKCMRSL